jgi:hypothetical protein
MVLSRKQHLLSFQRRNKRRHRYTEDIMCAQRRKYTHENQMIGVLRSTYSMFAPDRSISVYLDPKKSFATTIALHRHGFKNIVITVDEWEQLMSSSEEVEKYLHSNNIFNSPQQQDISIGNRYVLQFTERWNRKGILLSLRRDIPTMEDLYSLSDIYISLSNWNALKTNFNVMQHGITTRLSWEDSASEVYTSVYTSYMDALKENSVDTCGSGGELGILQNIIENFVQIERHDCHFPDTFNCVTLLHEMITFYPHLF